MVGTGKESAEHLRSGFGKGKLEGMRGPPSFVADEVEVRYRPPRAADGFYDGQRLRDCQAVEAAVFQKVLPDAILTDATVVTRADDQVITVMTLSGTLADGSAYRNPVTMVYNVRKGQIVSVIGIYVENSLAPFAAVFPASAKNSHVPLRPPPASQGPTP